MCYFMDAPPPHQELNMNFLKSATPVPNSAQLLPPLLIPAGNMCTRVIREPKVTDKVRLPPISCILNEINTSPDQQRLSPLEPQYSVNSIGYGQPFSNSSNSYNSYGQSLSNSSSSAINLSRTSSLLSTDMNPSMSYSSSYNLPRLDSHASLKHIMNDVQVDPYVRSSPLKSESSPAAHNSYFSSKTATPSFGVSPSSSTASPPLSMPLGSPSIFCASPLPTAASSKVSKPLNNNRRRYKCPVCCKSVANLVTHSSIHLAVNNRPHACTTCGRSFARSNDLQRHIKRHIKNNYDVYNNKSNSSTESFTIFKCPFFSSNCEHQCHQNGVFSRVDTFKNHLKAIHFKYPLGTKKKERSLVDGNCKLCDKHFDNVGLWLNGHVLNNQCSGIITKQELHSQ